MEAVQFSLYVWLHYEKQLTQCFLGHSPYELQKSNCLHLYTVPRKLHAQVLYRVTWSTYCLPDSSAFNSSTV